MVHLLSGYIVPELYHDIPCEAAVNCPEIKTFSGIHPFEFPLFFHRKAGFSIAASLEPKKYAVFRGMAAKHIKKHKEKFDAPGAFCG
jgi:hypothetical protein